MRKRDVQNELFENEQIILDKALADIEDKQYQENKLLKNYREITMSYSKLLKLAGKVFKISDVQGRELKRRTTEIKNLLDNASQGFLTFGSDLVVNKEFSAECSRIFGRKIAGMQIAHLLSQGYSEAEENFHNAFEAIFNASSVEEQNALLKKLPEMIVVGESYINIKYKVIKVEETEDKDEAMMLVLTDITEKRKAEDQVLYLSYHDKLTSLYNRVYIESVIPQLQTEHKMPMSVILADMNGLKLTNDVFGHEYGDTMIKEAATVFLSCCRKSDIVARWGGDEFLILLPNTNQAACEAVCRRIKEGCSKKEPNPIQLSVSLGSATMESPTTGISELLNVAENRMYSSKIIESRNVRRKIIVSVENSLHTKCYEDCGHVDRIKKMATTFAEILQMPMDSMETVTLLMLASFHDIGKVAIPRELLGKRGKLTNNEWEIMKSHTEVGFRMAQSIDEPILGQAILALREWWNGTGYPYGLKQEQIPYIARIIAILDAFDVMTHDRPYKAAVSKEEAVREIERSAGTQFDPELVQVFLSHLDEIVSVC